MEIYSVVNNDKEFTLGDNGESHDAINNINNDDVRPSSRKAVVQACEKVSEQLQSEATCVTYVYLPQGVSRKDDINLL